MFAADHHEAISHSVVREGSSVQRMLRRGCRLSHSARQRQGALRVILPRGCRSLRPADYCQLNKCPRGDSAVDKPPDSTPVESSEQPPRKGPPTLKRKGGL